MRRAIFVCLLLAGCRKEPEAIKAELPPPPTPREDLKKRHRTIDPHKPAMMVSEAVPSEMPPPPQCEPGELLSCMPSPPGHRQYGPFMHCRRQWNGQLAFSRADCNTPLVLSFDGAAVEFTKPEGTFTVGRTERTEWVSSRTPWLALDADGSGCIESQAELFGAEGDARNGFEKLARLDDNHDGRIDAEDRAFSKLVLWYDRDQDRSCSADEIVALSDAGVVAIDLAWRSIRNDVPGSFEGEEAPLVSSRGRGRVIDVYLAPMLKAE